MGGGLASHETYGRKTSISWEEDQSLMGGVLSDGRVVSWVVPQRVCLKGEVSKKSWRGGVGEVIFVSKEKCQRSLGEEELENYVNGRSVIL